MKKIIQSLLRNKKIVGLLFGMYLLVLCYFLFLSGYFGRTECSISYRYNLIPFKEISRYIKRFDSFGFLLVSMNLAGNILAFVPLGLFLPAFFKDKKKGKKSVILGFVLVMIVELIQGITKVGSCDVDDILLNMLGIFLGIFLFFFFIKEKKEIN